MFPSVFKLNWSSDMNVDTSKIEAQIVELVNEVEALEHDGFRLMDSRRAQLEVIRVVNERTVDFASEEFSDLVSRAAIAGKVDHIDRLRATLDEDLMHITTRYVITDGPLVSPAGFSKEDRVFLQTTIAIHCNKVPTELPHTDCPLYVNDLVTTSAPANEDHS